MHLYDNLYLQKELKMYDNIPEAALEYMQTFPDRFAWYDDDDEDDIEDDELEEDEEEDE